MEKKRSINNKIELGKKSELIKVADPKYGVYSRRKYYTKLCYKINGIEVSHPFLIDTGSSFTVVGLKHPAIELFSDLILESGLKDCKAYDATDDEILLKCFVVSDFRLTNDIIIPKLKLHFSTELDTKCLLGMDILSIFDFQYKKDNPRTRSGSFWINNYDSDLLWLSNNSLNKELNYVDPDLILDLSIINK